MFIDTYVFADCTRTLMLYNIWWVIKQTGGCLHKQHICNAIKKKCTKQKKTILVANNAWFLQGFSVPTRTPFWFWELIEIIITMVYYHHYHIAEWSLSDIAESFHDSYTNSEMNTC